MTSDKPIIFSLGLSAAGRTDIVFQATTLDENGDPVAFGQLVQYTAADWVDLGYGGFEYLGDLPDGLTGAQAWSLAYPNRKAYMPITTLVNIGGTALRRHMVAVVRWMQNLRINYQTLGGILSAPKNNVPILIIPGPTDSPFAGVIDQLGRNGWLTSDQSQQALEKLDDLAAMPLPFAIYTTGNPQQAQDIQSVAQCFRGPPDDIDPATGKRSIYPFPTVNTVDHNFDIVCGSKQSYDYITEWIIAQFSTLGAGIRETFLTVQHAQPFGTAQQSFRLTSINDSPTEPPDSNLRHLQVTFTLRTYIFRPRCKTWQGLEATFAD